ncbi:hypothetical protein [Xylophilus sp.]|uniref:hypothetical protein n=1 Tax=Xylophilus sp. TaxID=2653893 RepID=UPI0013BB4F17|nr:hypothetical protein [Xylophilus sp.]KAF1048079.1 MAG: hypothetical protein GAK38_01550 [Xylophilus sp.]
MTIESVSEAELRYTVTLHYPGLPAEARLKAEARYIRALERGLGGHGAAADALLLMQSLQDSDGAVAEEDIATLKRWQAAVRAAQTAGFQGLGESEDAYFDFRT